MTLGSLTRSDLARRLGGPGLPVRCGPLVMRLGTSLPELVDAISLLYADFPVHDDQEIPDFEVRVDPSWPVAGRLVGSARAFVDGRAAFDPFKRRHALPMFEWAVNWCVFTRPNRYLLLHSAVVERGGKGLLLSGKPGSGKSTLTAGLLFRGWRLLSDEVAMVPPGTRDLQPLPRPVGLKEASIDIVRALSPDAVLGPAAPETRKGTVAHLRPPLESIRRADEPAEPTWMVFPRFEENAPTELRRVSRAEALLRVGGEAFNYSILGSVGFETLADVVEGCECYELQFGNLADAIAAIDEVCGATEECRQKGRPSGRPDAGELKPAFPSAPDPGGRKPALPVGGSPSAALVLDALRDPASMATLGPADWTRLIGLARHARLLPRLGLLVEDEGLMGSLPARVREQLASDRPIGQQHERIIRWEVGRVSEALKDLGTKVVLLKGAAYVMAGLPAGRGRLVSDVDILVPRADLRRAEQALLSAGWEHVKLDPYDQRFYREWSHELPPLRHRRRGSTLDVHHTILPVSGRLHPDAEALLSAAVPLTADLWTLSPEDMVLHTAAHLFQDGDLAGSLRDLVDADSLLRDFGRREPGFWSRLVPRAHRLELARPLFYTLRYARLMLGTPVPQDVQAAISSAGPPAPVRMLMDRLVARALLPVSGSRGTLGEDTARTLLYVRSHWLRMPPVRLIQHLTKKATRRWRKDEE